MLLDPEIATVKSKPVPDSATLAAEAAALELTVNAPVAAPLAMG
jgi:hypothetical protein